MTLRIELTDLTKNPKPYGVISGSFGGPENPGHYDFKITPVSADHSSNTSGEWHEKIYGKNQSHYDLYPGATSSIFGWIDDGVAEKDRWHSGVDELWETAFGIRDFTDRAVMKHIKSYSDDTGIRKAENAALKQKALVKGLKAKSVVEAVSAKLMSHLLAAEEITLPEAQAFMQTHFEMGSVRASNMFRAAATYHAQNRGIA